jgi:hypothetical protein
MTKKENDGEEEAGHLIGVAAGKVATPRAKIWSASEMPSPFEQKF